jgi:hypothetical protein
MSRVRKTLLMAGVTAVVAISAFVKAPLAQNNVTGGQIVSQQLAGRGASATADPAVADAKAEAAMTAGSNPTPTTEADRKAAAAMSK